MWERKVYRVARPGPGGMWLDGLMVAVVFGAASTIFLLPFAVVGFIASLAVSAATGNPDATRAVLWWSLKVGAVVALPLALGIAAHGQIESANRVSE